MRKRDRTWVLGAVLVLGLAAQASAVVNIDFVPIGDPMNAADPGNTSCGPAGGLNCGAVAVPYRIGRFEVTNAQYAEFLNAVAKADPNALYDAGMAGANGGIMQNGATPNFSYTVIAGRGLWAVNFVTFFDALRFINWLHNGQPMGAQDATTTEGGAYTFAGAPAVGPARNPGARFFLPSEDEWYKAAYRLPGAANTYFLYPAGTSVQTVCAVGTMAVPNATANRANCSPGGVGNVTDVGSYTASSSPYGTFDQGGNVFEWNEAIIGGSFRGIRGGSWNFGFAGFLAASGRIVDSPSIALSDLGFRVASPPPPPLPSMSPIGLTALGLALAALLAWRRRS